MKKWLESLLLAMLAIAPSVLAILSMHQYGEFGVSCALVLCGIYLLTLATVLSTRCCRQRFATLSGRNQLQESPVSDSPPSYESVTSKPPPYDLLYGEALASGDMSASPLSGKYDCAPVHGRCPERVDYMWLEGSCGDPALPSYSEVMSPSSQHPSVVSHLPE